MLVELSLSKKELARYRDDARRRGVSIEKLIQQAVHAAVTKHRGATSQDDKKGC